MDSNCLGVACGRCLQKQNVPSEVALLIFDFLESPHKEHFLRTLSDELDIVAGAMIAQLCELVEERRGQNGRFVIPGTIKYHLPAHKLALFELPKQRVISYLELCLARAPFSTKAELFQMCTHPPCTGQMNNQGDCIMCGRSVNYRAYGTALVNQFDLRHILASERCMTRRRRLLASALQLLQRNKPASLSQALRKLCLSVKIDICELRLCGKDPQQINKGISFIVEELVCSKSSLIGSGLELLQEKCDAFRAD